jgi:hypothetical protein
MRVAEPDMANNSGMREKGREAAIMCCEFVSEVDYICPGLLNLAGYGT